MVAAGRAARPQALDYLLLGLLGLLWGSSFLFIKLAVATIPPLSVAAGRLACGALLLWAATRARGIALPADPAAWRRVAGFALAGMVVPFALISWGETRIDSGLTAILMAVIPLGTVLLAHLLQPDERLDAGRLAGVALGLGGILLLVGPAALAGLGRDLAGQLAVLASTLCYALAGNLGRRLAPLGPERVGAMALICGAVMLAPVALAVDRPWTAPPSAGSLLALLALGTVGTAGGYLVFFRLLGRCGAGFPSFVNFLVPPVGVAWGVLLLGEAPAPDALAALLVILLGVAMPRLWPRRVQA
jgi:drug/metabolite transporter (DMT)-like permease